MMRNDDLRCQEIGVFDMVDHLGGCLDPQLTGIDVYGCELRRGKSGQKRVVKGKNGQVLGDGKPGLHTYPFQINRQDVVTYQHGSGTVFLLKKIEQLV